MASNGQSADSLRAEDLVKKSIAALKRGEADSAARFHQQALDIFSAKNYWIPWMKSHVNLAYTWADPIKQPFVGTDLIERAIRQAPRPPQTSAEWEQICLTYLAKAYIYEEYSGDFISAKREYEKGFQIFLHQLKEHSDRIAGYLYYKYGNLCTRLGDYERARMLLQGGINYGQKYNLPNIAKYGDLAIVLLELNDNQAVLSMAREAVSHLGTLAEPIITLRRTEARACLNLGNLAAAQKAIAEIPGLIRRAKTEDSDIDEAYYWSGYYEILAAMEDATGRYAASAGHYQRAIQYETETWGTSKRREVGKLHWLLGDLYLRQHQPEAALAAFQQTLQCVIPAFQPKNNAENPQDTLFYAENTILEALEGKAKAFKALNQLEKALECYELMPTVEAQLRATHAYESSKLMALSESRHRFDAAVSIAWLLYEQSHGDRRYADRAFRLTEQARGMLLLQSLALAHANYQLPEELRQRESELNIKIAWYEHEIAAEREAGKDGDPVRLARLEKERFDLKQENEKLRSEIRQRFPDYAALSDEIRFLESAAVPTLLHSNQLLLDFYLTEEAAYVFSFDEKGGFGWRRALLPPQFRESVVQLVQYLQQGDEEDKAGAVLFRQKASEWYQLLLAPELNRLLPQTGSLVIIPDDALVFVPMEVLLRQPVVEGNWRDLPWLLADYNTGYAYSATLLNMQQTISQKHRERREALRYAFGGFAPSYSASSGYNLTSTEPLVNSARQLLGGNTWCGPLASEEQFKQVAPDCRILLLAMHGLADAENPELSRLLFGDPGADTLENDNVLYASELQIMQLQADLAVLSACHSGFGKLQKGEGVFSLARAFAQAGVPATVMSLWLLHESAAGPLMQSFLQYLQAGKTKDEALRLAKLDFLRNNQHFDLTHPFYWAGVTTSGDMCALDLPKTTSFAWWWLAIGGLALLAGGWFWRKRNAR